MKHLLAIASAAALTATAANAESIPNGTYEAKFGQADCGVLVSTSRDLKYTYGPCGKAATYVAQNVSRSGNVVSIDKARYVFSVREDGSLIGDWTFGQTFKAVFRRVE